MGYATKQNMIDRFGEQQLIELTDRAEPATNAIVDSILDAALDDASAYIDTYIRRRYELPLATTPPALRRACETVAWYDLHRGRHTEEDRTAYDDAMKFIADISNGAARLDVSGTEPVSAPAQAILDGPDRTFNRDKLKGF